MKMHDKCFPCIVNQVLKSADIAGITDKEALLREAFTYLSKADYNLATPELIGEIFEMIKFYTGNSDPYKNIREYYNALFLKMLPDLEHKIEQTDNPFQTAVRYAIVGNIIDFHPLQNALLEDISAVFADMEQFELAIDDTQLLQEDIRKAEIILYLGDNCGEICLDKILLKKIKQLNPDVQLFFGVRGKPVVNDVTEEDAYFVGIDAYARITDNGDYALGTVLRRTSPAFQKLYAQADIVIAKGQANYECLSEENKNIYFLLMTKCHVIADSVGTGEKKMICMKQN